MRQKFLLLAAVFFGVLAFVFTFQQINKEKAKIMAEAQDIYLLQVTKDILKDDKITEEMLRQVKVKRFATSGTSREVLAEQKNLVIGRQAQDLITAGSFIQWNDLKSSVASGRSGLTTMIKPGYRAISIPVDATSSVTSLVQPNNYVDLVGTFRFPDAKGDSSMDTLTLTILQRVRVIATGTDMGMLSGSLIQRQASQGRSYSTVTLELTPKEVEMIIFATQKGRMTLSLRSFEDSAITAELQSVNWQFLQDNIQKYTKEREALMKSGR